MKKRILLTLAIAVMLVVALALSVGATKIDGIEYTLTSSTDYSGFDGYAVVGSNKSITIAELVIPASVTYDGKTYIVTEISKEAFVSNGKITSVVIGENVTKLNDSVFNRCSKLVSVEFGPNLVSIGSGSFSSCTSLKSVNYTGTLDQWLSISFGGNTANPVYYAKSLNIDGSLFTELNIPDGLTTINKYAFINCESIVKVTVPASVTSISTDVFAGCSNITELRYAGSINDWCTKITFSGTGSVPCTPSAEVYFNDVKFNENFVIPESITKINAYSFARFPTTSLTIHTGLKSSVSKYAFANSTNLDTVDLPSGMKTVPEGIFYGCTSIVSIVIPDTVTSFSTSCFEKCSSLKEVNIPSGVTSLGNSSFRSCTALEEIDIPTGVSSIAQYAFEGCTNLYCVNGNAGALIFWDKLTQINVFSFSNCDRIEYVEFPATLTKVNQGAFAYCDNLKLVSFDKVNAKIKNAIANGESYSKVEFPGCGVFKGCSSLVAMSIPEGTVSLPDRFLAENCNALTAIYMPDSIQKLCLNGDNWGSFDNAPNMYFVDDSFTVSQCYSEGVLDLSKLVLPKKPTVYYMPESLTMFSGNQLYTNNNNRGSMFKNCKSINDVLVFGENFVDMRATTAFYNIAADSPKTVVFLGQLTQFVWGEGNANVTFVFANKNVTDVTNMGLIKVYSTDSVSKYLNTGATVYFCSSDKAYDFGVLQVKNRSKDVNDALYAELAAALTENADLHAYKCEDITDSNCTEAGVIKYYCPCGKYVDEDKNTIIDPKGHIKGDFVTIEYENGFLKIGHSYHKCNRKGCTVESFTILDNAEYQVPAIFVNNGYAYSGTAILQGFAVNFGALEAYETTGKTLQYGLAVASVAKLGATNTLFDGTTLKDGAFSVSFDDKRAYSIFEMQVTGLTEDYHNTELFVCAYVIDGDTVSYISNGANTSTVESVTYNEVIANAEQNQTTDIIIKKEENA